MGRRCKGPLGWAALLLLSFMLPGFPQTQAARAAHAGPGESAQATGIQPGAVGEIAIEGCNYVDNILTSKGTYWLAGDTSPLRPYASQLVRIVVRHVLHSLYGTAAEFVRFEKTLPPPPTSLNDAVRDSYRWQRHKNPKYGLRFAVPSSFPATEVERAFERPEFVNPQGTVALASYEIPLDTYHGPDLQRVRIFAGGHFAIFANPEIANEPSCLQFGNRYPGTLSWRMIGRTRYRESVWGGAAAGTGYKNDTFHTLQHGLCYAITVETAFVNPGNFDGGCMLPVITAQQESDLDRRLLARLAYSKPEIALKGRQALSASPIVVSFTASSRVADNLPVTSRVTFSWTTRDADYVRISCLHPNARAGIPEPESPAGSKNQAGISLAPVPCQDTALDYPPNGSASVYFYNWEDDPIEVAVTLTPFSRATPYPAENKTIGITVARLNQFPDGVPTESKNISILGPSSSAGPLVYKQGAQLTVRWTDSLDSDRCVNLYLVQDQTGAAPNYLTQINRSRGCVSPAKNGSFTWTIPQKYAGSGFRILLASGTVSTALSVRFSIVP
ncbi:MAG TPA: hypothetical protein VGS20_02795 [Candidatus Acidoferrales bacterium]|nr:hypothetical protein [Candidatus Acidoferrales bacterium]